MLTRMYSRVGFDVCSLITCISDSKLFSVVCCVACCWFISVMRDCMLFRICLISISSVFGVVLDSSGSRGGGFCAISQDSLGAM